MTLNNLGLEKFIIKEGFNGNNNQTIFKFPNGFGASVIIGIYTYGGDQGLYELAILKFHGDNYHLDYSTCITDDVIGYLEPKDVRKLLMRIKRLKTK